MSTFEVKVYKLEILPHPNADAIELAKVGDYLSIVKKGDFKTNDLGVYIPEQALVPDWILQEMGLTGKLAGSNKNRVKAIKLRGVLSQGIIYPITNNAFGIPFISRPSERINGDYTRASHKAEIGTELSSFLGITKWEPIIPQHMKGKAVGVALNLTVNYDIENIKKYNEIFKESDIVAITEKIHGTFIQIGSIPLRLSKPELPLYLGAYTVSSKGLGGKGILLDFLDDTNVYSKVANDKRYNLQVQLPCIRGEFKEIIGDNPIYILGEIYGPGVQKGFNYGVSGSDIQFRAFDIAYGERSNLQYIDFVLFQRICKIYEIPMVPLLYIGPYSTEILKRFTSGFETVSGKKIHMREGCVIKPLRERRDDKAGRVVLKSLSETYLLRSGEVTEYQ